MTFVLGVDGGNSKTIAVVASLDARVVGYGRAGCSDIYGAASATLAVQEVTEASLAALAVAGVARGQVTAAVFSLAGADWPEDVTYLTSALLGHGLGKRVTVVNDALGALRAGSPDGTGVVVVCGTGAAVGARSAQGATWHSGWWQDTHGSRHLAEKALRAACRAELGIGPATSLRSRVGDAFGQGTVEEALHRLTARNTGAFAPEGQMTRILLEEAESGDPVARDIVRAHGEGLGDFVVAAARHVGLGARPFHLVLAGGVFRHHCPLLADSLVWHVQSKSLPVRPVRARLEPAIGAVLLALETAGVVIDAIALARLHASLPPVTLFAT